MHIFFGITVSPMLQVRIRRLMIVAEMATGSDNTHTPWAQIGLNPSHYFDEACIPDGFKFQDPSRMGLSVKELLNHLRQRQEVLGVCAFRFHHILRNHKVVPAEYPEDAMEVIEPSELKPEEENDSVGKKKKVTTKSPQKVPVDLPGIEPRDVPTPSDPESKGTVVKLDSQQNQLIPHLSSSPVTLKTESTVGYDADTVGGLSSDKMVEHRQIPQKVEHRQNTPTQQSVGPQMAFHFPTEATYQSIYNQTTSQPSVYNPMPMQAWPPPAIMNGPNFNTQGTPSAGLPYPVNPMLNFYHPQYGIPQIHQAQGHLTYMQSQSCPPALDPHLQLPPGEPTFYLPPLRSAVLSPSVSAVASEATKLMIDPPTYTPTKPRSPQKSSPRKRKQFDHGDTPSRRSGRSVKTPKRPDA